MDCPLCKISVTYHFNNHLYNNCSLFFKVAEPKHPTMNCVEKRKSSFSGWPKQKISIKNLAEAGFYFTKIEDAVTCHWCGVTIKRWQLYDDALEKHLNEKPGCMFLWDTYFFECKQAMISVCKECNLFTVDLSHSLRCMGLLKKDIKARNILGMFPRNPKMKTETRRLQTFDEWPLKEPFVKDLVDSGFYYSGMGDMVICFYCDGVLNNWLNFDNPFLKHLEKYPDCKFAKWTKQIQTKVAEVNYEVMKLEMNRFSSFYSWPKRQYINVEHLAKIGFFSLGHQDYVQCAFCKVIIGNWSVKDLQHWDTEYMSVRIHLMKSPQCPFMKGLNVKNIPVNSKILRPLHPDMMNEIKRLTTFKDCKKNISKFDLAESGFYYCENIIKCFWCSFEINDIEENFLETHAKSRPECIFAQVFVAKETRSEKLSNDCKICLTAECEILFIPCYHFVSCVSCANKIKNCCVCRQAISEKIKIYKC